MCGRCRNCSSGKPALCETHPRDPLSRMRKAGEPVYHARPTFAEQSIVLADACVKVPDDTQLEKACLISCGVITRIGAVVNRARVEQGATMAVFGCGGGGLNVIQGGVLASAGKIIAVDTVAYKLELAEQMGATHFVNAAREDHEKADRLYRVILNARLMGKLRGATSPAPMAQALMEEVPEVETATRLYDRSNILVSREDRRFTEEIFYADSTYFDVFTHPLVAGDPSTALKEPNSIVLTETTAQKYFGSSPALGERLTLNSDEYVVTGVAEDIPPNAHFHVDFLASLVTLKDSRNQRWVSNNYGTYLVLKEGRSQSAVEANIATLIRKVLRSRPLESRAGVRKIAFASYT